MLAFDTRSDSFLRSQDFLLGQASPTTAAIKVTLQVIFLKEVIVEWVVPRSWDCTFNIYYSLNEQGPYTKVNVTQVSGNYFRDIEAKADSKYRSYFYIVEAVFQTGQKTKSFPVTWENKRSSWVELRAKEIQRRESLLLTKFTGVDSYIFKKRIFGQRCNNCWDTELEKVTWDHCPVCLGTSFKGGYFPGFKTKLQYEPTPNQSILSSQGVLEQNTIPAWTIDYPRIDTFDIILRIPDFSMYRVNSIQTTELQTALVRQMLQLTELDKESIEFNLATAAIPQL